MLLDFFNPDGMDAGSLQYYFDQLGSNDGSPSPVPDVRPDGYAGRPALTCTTGHAFVGLYPQVSQPQINPASLDRGFMGGRWLFESFPGSPRFLHAFVTGSGAIQVMSALRSDGKIAIYRGFYDTELAVSADALDPDTFYKLGFTAVIGANGTATVWNDEDVFCRIPLGNTEAQPGFGWRGVVFGLPQDCALNHGYYGDVFGIDRTIQPNLFVKRLSVVSEGAFTDWIATSGSYADVLNVAPPDFAETLQAYANLARFSAVMSELDESPRIYATKETLLVRNIDSTLYSARPSLERDGIMDDGMALGDVATPCPVGSDWQRVTRIDWGNLWDGNQWTTEGVNLMRWGNQLRMGA